MSKTITICALALLGLALLFQSGQAKSIYRGVAADKWTGGCADINALSRMSWYYNWGLEPNVDCDLGDRYLEYVPMVWGKDSIAGFVSKLPPNTTHLLAFNEPNFSEQSRLTPAEAADAWKTVIADLEEANLLGSIKLGTPSASPGGDLLGPQDWFKQFFGNCTGCKFDFLTFHIYDCTDGIYGFNYWVEQAASFGLPVWITEFNCPSNSVPDEVAWMAKALDSLDNNTSVERYAWFAARTDNTGTAPSLLNSAAGSLTDVGVLYNSKGDSLSPQSGGGGGSGGGGSGGGGSGGGGGGSGSGGGSSSASTLVPHALTALLG